MSCSFHKSLNQKPFSFFGKIHNLLKLFQTEPSDFLNTASHLQAILDTTVDSIITINEEKSILAFNKTAEKMFGYQKEEVLHKNVNILMPEPFHEEHDSYIEDYIKTGVKKIIGIGRNAIAKRKDGSTFPINLAVSEVLIGNKRFFTGILRDISEQQAAAATLEANIRMQSEISAKNEYTSILSHELRTPLTSLYGALGLLVIQEGHSAKTKELLTIAYNTSQRLVKLVNDLLDLGKIQSGKLIIDFMPVSLDSIIKEAVKTIKPISDKMKVCLTIKEPLPSISVLSNSDRLIQIMINLLSNAIKFSQEHGEVFISLKLSNKSAVIYVQNIGMGIPENFKEKIFTPFSQAENNTSARSAGGAGLGLHICKSIIEQLGGSIGFSSTKEGETSFYITLPTIEEKS